MMPLTRTTVRACGVAFVMVLLAITASAQTSATRNPSAKGSILAVTSVKESSPGSVGSGIPQWSGDRLTVIGTTLRGLILRAYPGYGVERLAGEPSWVASTRFDIRATVSDPALLETENQRVQALRALVEDRFGLIISTDVRDVPVYALVKAHTDGRLGPGLRRSQLACGDLARLPPRVKIGQPIALPGPEQRPACGMAARDGLLVAGHVTIDVIPSFLLGKADRMVIDRTGLTEQFDVVLTYSAAAGFRLNTGAADPGQDGPSIFAALEEQLGLKLQPTRAPVEFLVVAHVDPPTPD